MEWKPLFYQSVITCLIVFFGIRFLSPDPYSHINQFQKAVVENIQEISNSLKELSNAERRHRGTPNLLTPASSISSEATNPSTIAEINRALLSINQNLDDIFESLQRLEEGKDSRLPSMLPAPGMSPNEKNQFLGRGKPDAPGGWMLDLPESKKAMVDSIFKEQRDDLVSRFPDNLPKDPQAMKEIMENHNEELKAKLKSVLNDDEYQKFVNSTERKPNIQGLPIPVPNK